MPLQETSGAASYDAYGGGAAVAPVYIEDVFSTWLYTGNGSTQTITNGIDLAGKGGLVWCKNRTTGARDHILVDTVRGATNVLYTDAALAQAAVTSSVTSFNSNGFSIGALTDLNQSTNAIVSWTFRKQPKFFDVVTWTGDGVTNRQITHSLGAYPGCIIVKRLDAAANWKTYHVTSWSGGVPVTFTNMQLNTADAGTTAFTGINANGRIVGNGTTAITLQAGSSSITDVNANGGTYVAYLFAHNAGGFGLTGADNVISCGAFTTDGSTNAFVELGYEPQWVMIKNIQNTGDWFMYDNMRGWSQTTNSGLRANLSNAEFTSSNNYRYTYATGFKWGGDFASNNYIYIAIRRGPMKVPADGTKVFSPNTSTTNPQTLSTGFPVDLSLVAFRGGGGDTWAIDRLRGSTGTSAKFLVTQTTSAEGSSSGYGLSLDSNTGVTQSIWNNNSIFWNFRRAPGFFDEVCYTGTGVARTVNHNLGVAPELMIVKSRSNGTAGYEWAVYSSGLTSAAYYLLLNTNAAQNSGTAQWNSTAPTASVFSVGASSRTNGSGATYVAYLFASCPGVSKVGSYTGNGSTQTINCGFTGGARFVLIKRTDAAGDWYVYDTARGMTTLTDPYLLLNSTAAESATLGSVTTVPTGFAVNAAILAAINTNAATYIFLAIA